MKKYLAELIGTFALVFCGTGAIVINQESGGVVTHVGIAITFGLVVMSMVYAMGDVSGAHINPAVSIAFTVSRKFPLSEVLPYVISQMAGAVIASPPYVFSVPGQRTARRNVSRRHTHTVICVGADTNFFRDACNIERGTWQ